LAVRKTFNDHVAIGGTSENIYPANNGASEVIETFKKNNKKKPKRQLNLTIYAQYKRKAFSALFRAGSITYAAL
jgi:hypothetical protein